MIERERCTKRLASLRRRPGLKRLVWDRPEGPGRLRSGWSPPPLRREPRPRSVPRPSGRRWTWPSTSTAGPTAPPRAGPPRPGPEPERGRAPGALRPVDAPWLRGRRPRPCLAGGAPPRPDPARAAPRSTGPSAPTTPPSPPWPAPSGGPGASDGRASEAIGGTGLVTRTAKRRGAGSLAGQADIGRCARFNRTCGRGLLACADLVDR